MAEDRGESDPLEALTSKIDFKMNLFNDVMAEHREIKQLISGVMKEKESFQQEKAWLQQEKDKLQQEKESLLHEHLEEKERLQQEKDRLQQEKDRLQQEKERVLHEHLEEKERLQQDKERLLHEYLANKEALARMKEDILSSKKALVEARDALVSSKELISQKNNYVKKKLQESEAKNNQAGQQGGTKPAEPGVQTRSLQKRKRTSKVPLDYDSDTNEPTSQLDDRSLSSLESLENPNVKTRSMGKKRRPSERTLGNDADNLELIKEGPRPEVAQNPTVGQISGVQLCDEDDLEAIRDELIKGFLEIDYGRRKLGIKEMGELSEKAFKTACRAKVPPEEVSAAFDQLYSSWQQHLGDLSWYPFKSVTIDGNCEEIVNLDDDKLQELKRVWGQGAHDAVITALVEMKEYDCLSDRSIVYELWNYKEGRKATMRDCVQYLFNQVKVHSAAKRRNTLRSSGRA